MLACLVGGANNIQKIQKEVSSYTHCNSRVFVYAESRFKEKHSLDSDEEDEVKEGEKDGLGDEDLAAQEDTTIVSVC